jgi:predicted nucleic acid-binding protein
MRFWDASAIVPTLVAEAGSVRMRELADDGSALAVWWGTRVECVSAIARRVRLAPSDARHAEQALDTLHAAAAAWLEVPPTERLRDDAGRLVRVHDLRAADAFQLAAARAASDDHPEALPFVTLDDRLALAASREGFPVLGLG